MLASFRDSSAASPDGYFASIVDVLCDYPEEAVARVCHPSRGIPGYLKFAPSVAEVREACEEEVAPIYRAAERLKRQDDFERVALPGGERQKPHHETLHEKFKHLDPRPFPQVPEGPDRDRISESVAARAEETIKILKAVGTREARNVADSIRAMAEQMTGKKL